MDDEANRDARRARRRPHEVTIEELRAGYGDPDHAARRLQVETQDAIGHDFKASAAAFASLLDHRRGDQQPPLDGDANRARRDVPPGVAFNLPRDPTRLECGRLQQPFDSWNDDEPEDEDEGANEFDPADYALQMSGDGRTIIRPPVPRISTPARTPDACLGTPPSGSERPEFLPEWSGDAITERELLSERGDRLDRRRPSYCRVLERSSLLAPEEPADVYPLDQRRKRTGMGTQYPWRAIGAVTIDGSVAGTGTLIGPRAVLTAAHVCYDGGSLKGSVKFIPGRDGFGDWPTYPHQWPVVWAYAPAGWREDGDYRYDWCVLIMADSEYYTGLGWFGLGSYSSTSLKQTSVWHFGYPRQHQDDPLCWEMPCGGYLWGSEGWIYKTYSKRIYTRHDVTRGHSGGPVYRYNGGNRKIVGIMATMASDYSKATRVTSSRISQWCGYIAANPSQHNQHPDCV